MADNKGRKWIGYYNPSIWLTLFGSFVAIFGMSQSYLGYNRNAVVALMLCGLIDLFDGLVARLIKRNEAEKAFGIQLDSLADMISFVALPISIFLSLGFTTWWGLICLFIYAFAAVERLGFFNVTTQTTTDAPHWDIESGSGSDGQSRSQNDYRGLPVTYAALIFSWGWLLFERLFPSMRTAGMAVLLLATAALFVLDIPIPKPKRLQYIVFLLLAALTGILLFIV